MHCNHLFISNSNKLGVLSKTRLKGCLTGVDVRRLSLVPQEDWLCLCVGARVDPVQLVGHPHGVEHKEDDQPYP